MTHICVSEVSIIVSDNGLSPGRRQAIIWTNDGSLLIGSLGTNFSEILIEIRIFSFKKMGLKVSSAKCRPFCLGLNVLTYQSGVFETSRDLIHPHPLKWQWSHGKLLHDSSWVNKGIWFSNHFLWNIILFSYLICKCSGWCISQKTFNALTLFNTTIVPETVLQCIPPTSAYTQDEKSHEHTFLFAYPLCNEATSGPF